MKLRSLLLVCSLLTFGGVVHASENSGFSTESSDLKGGQFENKFVLNGFGCSGQNISPAISWRGIPEGTKSLALVMHDPDAPTGAGGFTHWVVVNIPATVKRLDQGAGNGELPSSAVGVSNGFDNTGVTGSNGGYGGPCPPVGDAAHAYVFTLYALAVEDIHQAAGIPINASSQVHGFILNHGLGASLLGKASFTARYANK